MKNRSWDSTCSDSIRREKAEVAKRYGIRVGQTEIYCASCNRPCWPGRHVCQDIQLQRLHESKKASSKKTPELCAVLRRFEPKIASMMLEVPVKHVRHWIERRNAPEKYRDSIAGLIEPRQLPESSNFGENAY